MPRLVLALILSALAPFAAAFAQSGNPSHDALMARADAERRSAFHQSLRAGGFACQAVSIAFPAGLDADRTAFWDLRCSDGAAYRAALPPERFAPAAYLACGAAGVPAPRSGPCFQTLAAVAALAENRAALAAAGQNEAACRQACAAQPAAAQAVCAQRCVSGQGLRVAGAASAPLPAAVAAASRFGVVYQTDPPLAVFGFANGAADRLEVNMRAIRQCQDAAGPVRCRFVTELVDSCGALALAVSRHPRAVAMTADPSTQVLNSSFVGRGADQAAAERQAMELCNRSLAPGAQCRIAAAGC